MAWGEAHHRRDDRRGEFSVVELIGMGFLAVLINQEAIMATQEELQASVDALQASVAALVSAEAAEDAGGLKPGQVAVDQSFIDGLNDHIQAAQAQVDQVTAADQANTQSPPETVPEPAPDVPVTDDLPDVPAEVDTQDGGETAPDPDAPVDPTPIGEDGQPIEG